MPSRIYRARNRIEKTKDANCPQHRANCSYRSPYLLLNISRSDKQLCIAWIGDSSSVLGRMEILQRHMGCNKVKSFEYGHSNSAGNYCSISLQSGCYIVSKNVSI